MNSQDNILSDTFIAMWDIYGLESLINVSEKERDAICQALKGEKVTWHNPIHVMIIRAKFNMQRHYEIYSFTSEMPESDIVDMFKSEPQCMVDTIRRIGNKIYSDRETVERVIT